MAKKNWEKISKGKYGELWENKKNKHRIKINYDPKLKAVTIMDDSGYTLFEKEFKTKKKAVAYAKKMMRLH